MPPFAVVAELLVSINLEAHHLMMMMMISQFASFAQALSYFQISSWHQPIALLYNYIYAITNVCTKYKYHFLSQPTLGQFKQ